MELHSQLNKNERKKVDIKREKLWKLRMAGKRSTRRITAG